MYSVIPESFQTDTPSPVLDSAGAFSAIGQGDVLTYDRSKDALGAVSPIGQSALSAKSAKALVIDTRTDPLGALDRQYGRFAPSTGAIHRDRLQAKMQNAFGLASRHDDLAVESARADKLEKI
jgi:hypothetical protein